MKHTSTHTRIYAHTLQNLRRIYAETGEAQIEILDRLIEAEWKRIQDENHQDVQVQAISVEKE
jgi:hypothetical protein